MRSVAASWLVLVALAIVGCGGGDENTTAEPPALPPPPATETEPRLGTAAVGVYFLRDEMLVGETGETQEREVVGFASRNVALTPAIGRAALEELLAGPNAGDREAGLRTDIPSGTTIERLAIENGVARVELSNPLDESAAAQVVYTLTGMPTVRRVELEGEEHVRKDFEQLTPSILVESPAPGEKVESPLRIEGTANTFEATFVATIVQGAKTISKQVVMATSGSGTRGTFEAELDYFVDRERPGKLVVYEESAADGSRIHEVEIPLVLVP